MGLSCYSCHVQLSRTCIPNLSCDYFNQSCSAEGKITPEVILPMRQNRQSTKVFVVHHDSLSDSFRIRIVWFHPKQDSDRIRISFFKNRIGSDSKISLSDHLCSRDDHYPVCRLDIRQHNEFAIGYGYPKTAFKREPETDPDIRNGFIDISRIQTFGKSCTLHNHSFSILRSIFSAFCAMTPSLSMV